MTSFELLTPPQLIDSVKAQIESKKDTKPNSSRVFTMKSMMMDAEGRMDELIELMRNTGEVHLIPDAHSTALVTWPAFQLALAQEPVIDRVTIAKPYHNWLYRKAVRLGRDHRKLQMLEDGTSTPTLWVGGMNFTGHAFDSIDVLAKIEDAPDLAETVKTTHLGELQEDKIVRGLDGKFDVIADSGKFGKSTIQKEANKIIAAAKEGEEVTIMTQFYPSGKFAKLVFDAAKRGVRINLITNNPAEQPTIAKLTDFVVKTFDRINRVHRELAAVGINIIFPYEFVHGKVLSTPSQVLWGSHNFTAFTSYLGGMVEASIRSSHPDIAHAFTAFCSGLVDELSQKCE